MGHKIRLATVCLHISAGLYLLLGPLMFLLEDDDTGFGFAFALGVLVFCLFLVAASRLSFMD